MEELGRDQSIKCTDLLEDVVRKIVKDEHMAKSESVRFSMMYTLSVRASRTPHVWSDADKRDTM